MSARFASGSQRGSIEIGNHGGTENRGRKQRITGALLPPLSGRPVRVRVRRSLGAHLAGSSIPGRFIFLDRSILERPGEFERILIHELFHFAWVRLSNAKRRDWEDVLAAEMRERIPGELGWSAQWRKLKLHAGDARKRTPVWRRYACESFCDTAAWRYSGLTRHAEFTLAVAARKRRKAWCDFHLASGVII